MPGLGELVFGMMRYRFRRGISGIAQQAVLQALSNQPESLAHATVIRSAPAQEAGVTA